MTPEDARRLMMEQALTAAVEYDGVVSLLCAAIHWKWQLKCDPERPQITVARNKRVDKTRVEGVQIRRLTLPDEDVEGRVTSRSRTVLDCLRCLPFDEALTVADSALRSGFSQDLLSDLAMAAKGPRSTRIRWVAHHASPLAANPFESVLRAIALQAGLHVRPQVRLGNDAYLGRPDLVDLELRIIIEADSFEFHGSRRALRADASRYNEFVADGWLVLRFTWEDVMLHPDQVRRVLCAAAAQRRTDRGSGAA